jgi:pSer/pThr/pTyr-binding forkhead associated (FHA) protein
MSGRHARIAVRGDKFVLVDEESRNGSFIRVKKEVELKPGDYLLLGKQVLRFEV